MSANNNSVLSSNHVKLSLKLITEQSLLVMSMSRTLSPWMWLKWITLKLENNLQTLLQLLEMRRCVMAALVNNCFATLRVITWECFGNKNQHLFQTMWRTEADSGAWEFVVTTTAHSTCCSHVYVQQCMLTKSCKYWPKPLREGFCCMEWIADGCKFCRSRDYAKTQSYGTRRSMALETYPQKQKQ